MMGNNPRVFLYVLLIFAGWLNYEAWMRDYSPANAAAAAQGQQPVAPAKDIGAAIPKAAAPTPDTSSAGSSPAVPAPATGVALFPAPLGLKRPRQRRPPPRPFTFAPTFWISISIRSAAPSAAQIY